MTDTSADTSAVTPAPTPAADTAKPHRKRRRDATDGRTSRSRRYRALLKQFLADMGGPGGAAALTEAQRQLCARCATLSAECERIEQQINAGETVDFVAYGVVVDRLGRALQRVSRRFFALVSFSTKRAYPNYFCCSVISFCRVQSY